MVGQTGLRSQKCKQYAVLHCLANAYDGFTISPLCEKRVVVLPGARNEEEEQLMARRAET